MDIKIQTAADMPVAKDQNLRIVAWCDSESPELARAYEELPGGGIAFHSGAAEQWHYLGTGRTAEGTFIHTFRHRCHPYTNERMYRTIKAMPTWFPSPTEVRGRR